jgi:predicted deacylase
MNSYPIEIDFPDIAPHAPGNTGIPYLYTFDSGVAGPHVMINALTHGNEVCGAIVVDELVRARLRPRRGKLTLSFANVAAYA